MEQLQTEIVDDTAAQLSAARGNERLTATLTDTMHEDTQVRDTLKLLSFIRIPCSTFFVYLAFHI